MEVINTLVLTAE